MIFCTLGKLLQLYNAVNIGEVHNAEIMGKCPLLAQYSRYVDRVRQYADSMSLEDAVELAVNECIRESIFADFLQKRSFKTSITSHDAGYMHLNRLPAK